MQARTATGTGKRTVFTAWILVLALVQVAEEEVVGGMYIVLVVVVVVAVVVVVVVGGVAVAATVVAAVAETIVFDVEAAVALASH